MSARFVYITAPTAVEAQRIASALIGERLAACANVMDGVRSLYWWEGAVQDEREAVLILKTREDLVEAVIERVRALHSYDCPCIVALPIEAGNPAFLDWIASETAAGVRR